MFSPNGPWAVFQGICTFQLRTISTFNGNEVELGTASNPTPETVFLRGVIGEYETQGLRWSATQASSAALVHDRVVEMFGVADWANEQFTDMVVGQPTVIPPCRDIIMAFTPIFRVIMICPVFHVHYYKDDVSGRMNVWIDNTVVQQSTSWRHWGGLWMAIFSPAIPDIRHGRGFNRR